MQRSIFRRYLSITMTIILLSFATLGGGLTAFFGQYWRQEKNELLTQNAAAISEFATRFLRQVDKDRYELPAGDLQYFLGSFSVSTGADIFITDLEGKVLLGSFADSKLDSIEKVPAPYAATAWKGKFEGRSDLDGVYPERYYIIGVPMTANGKQVGAVFAATSPATVNALQGELVKIFLLAALAALAAAFCLVGAFVYRMVRPLRQMALAAHSFGAGDFSTRVPVTRQDEMGQLAAAFNNMADSLSNSEGMRRSFIANVSHELKTPMTTIAGFIDGILDGTIPRGEQDKYLHIVSDEVKRLSRLVKSMLDLSRIDSGEMKIHPRRFDVTHTIISTLLTFEQPVDAKGIAILGLDEAGPVEVYGDQDLLHQVVYNLVENAVKFTNQGGTIRVQIIDSVDRTMVAIENTGPGIAAEDLPMVFDRFYKGDKSRSRDKNGMGLGLYLVRTILQLHGGNIWACSVPGEYCRFEFFLPKPQEAPKLKEGPQKGKDHPRLKEGKLRRRRKEPAPEAGEAKKPEEQEKP